MELMTKIAAALTCLNLSGCVSSSTEPMMNGCHKEGSLFVFDNNNYADFTRGISTVDCRNARENWMHMPHVFNGVRDPKTGLLP